MMRLCAWLAAGAAGLVPLAATAGSVKQTNLVSNQSGKAAFTDPNLVNAWGISASPAGPFWVSDNGTGLSTLYSTSGQPQGLIVTVPGAGGAAGAPTGQAFNPTTGFKVSAGGKSGAPAFIFATENGTISGWAPNVNGTVAINAVDNSAKGAVYKGLALLNGKTPYVLAANFGAQQVEVYDTSWHLVRSFRDSYLPASYSPFNVAVLGGNIYVSYAKHKKGSINEIDGPHLGAVDQVDITGTVVKTIALHGPLNAPWGLAIAPSTFGGFAGKLLVGNFGDGTINAYNPSTGTRVGALKTAGGQKLVIDGLWGLLIGNGSQGGNAGTLYFTAGPNGETNGLLGALDWVK